MPNSKNTASKAGKSKAPKKNTKKSKTSKESVVTETVETEALVAEPVVTELVVTEPAVAEPVVAELVVTEPAVAEPAVVEQTVVEPAVAEPDVAENATTSSTTVETVTLDLNEEVNSNFDSVLEQLSTLSQAVRTLASTVKTLQKNSQKQKKELSKHRRRKPVNKANRAPSGFAKPTYLSGELCDFLGVELGTMKARTEVTKAITNYIKEGDLQNPANKKIILLDNKLESLLKPNGDEVTYFNMQKYMKVHFLKENPVSA